MINEISFFFVSSVYFGESVVGLFADGIEKGLQIGSGELVYDEKFVFLVEHILKIIKPR